MPNLAEQLALLNTTGLVQRAAPAPDLEYLFRHALIQDAAYSSLLRADRKRLHRAVAEILETAAPDQRDEFAVLLARHFAAAQEPDRARTYYERAAAHALTRYSNQEAAAHYRAALALAPPAPDHARLLAGLGKALVNQGQFAEGIPIWREAVAAYQALTDGDGLARAYAKLAIALLNSGNSREALAVCREALAALAAYPSSPSRARLLNEMSTVHFWNGRIPEANDLARQALDLATQYGDQDTQILALITLGIAQAPTPVLARATLEEAAALADAAELPGKAGMAHRYLGARLIELGALDGARDQYQRARAWAEQIHNATYALFSGDAALYCTLWLGEVAAAAAQLPTLRHLAAQLDSQTSGVRLLEFMEIEVLRYQEGAAAILPRLEAALAQMWRSGDLMVQIVGAWNGSDILLEQGAWDQAQALLEAIRPVADRAVLFGRVWPRARLSRVAAATGDHARAQRWLAEATSLAGSPALLPDQVEMAQAQAAIASAAGQWSAVQEAYTAAAAALAQMGKRWDRARTLQAGAAAHLAEGPAADRAAIHALLVEAQAEFTAMGTPYYANQAAAALAAIRDST